VVFPVLGQHVLSREIIRATNRFAAPAPKFDMPERGD